MEDLVATEEGLLEKFLKKWFYWHYFVYSEAVCLAPLPNIILHDPWVIPFLLLYNTSVYRVKCHARYRDFLIPGIPGNLCIHLSASYVCNT